MISRRRFGICAICAAVTSKTFIATEVSAQTNTAVTGAIKRNMLSKSEVPGGNLVAILMAVEVPAGVEIPRHTHPGVESAYVLEGEAELYVQGRSDVKLMPNTAFQVSPETPHGVRKVEKPLKLAITYVVDKDKPLVTPAPA
jgi:quercetin dioxygenase-like cupin family protein